MIVFERGIFTGASAMFLQQGLAETPHTVRGVFEHLYGELLGVVPALVTALIVFAIFYLIAWAGMRFINYSAPRFKADASVVLLLSRLLYYGILMLGTITALGTAGLNVNALIAGLGLTGFALGFALKDVLSNLLSGIMLLVYRPFRIGDQITMGAYEGTIKAIRMRDTVVRSYDGRNIIIPNTKLITEVVVNNTANNLLREALTVNIASDADITRAREIFLQAMEKNPEITGRVEPTVFVKSLGDYAVQIEGRFWLDRRRANKEAVKSEVAQAVKEAFDEAGISMSYPTQRILQEVVGKQVDGSEQSAAA